MPAPGPNKCSHAAANVGAKFCLTLGYPADLNTAPNQISVLTPIGTALLGMAEGSMIEWPRRDGQAVQVRVLEVLSQWNGQACVRAVQ